MNLEYPELLVRQVSQTVSRDETRDAMPREEQILKLALGTDRPPAHITYHKHLRNKFGFQRAADEELGSAPAQEEASGERLQHLDEVTTASFTPPSRPGRTEIYPGGIPRRRASRDYHDSWRHNEDDNPASIESYRSKPRRDRPHRRPPVWPLEETSRSTYGRRPPLVHAATFDDYPSRPPGRPLLPVFEDLGDVPGQFGRDLERRRDIGYETRTRRTTVEHGRPRREDEIYAKRGGRRRDMAWE